MIKPSSNASVGFRSFESLFSSSKDVILAGCYNLATTCLGTSVFFLRFDVRFVICWPCAYLHCCSFRLCVYLYARCYPYLHQLPAPHFPEILVENIIPKDQGSE